MSFWLTVPINYSVECRRRTCTRVYIADCLLGNIGENRREITGRLVLRDRYELNENRRCWGGFCSYRLDRNSVQYSRNAVVRYYCADVFFLSFFRQAPKSIIPLRTRFLSGGNGDHEEVVRPTVNFCPEKLAFYQEVPAESGRIRVSSYAITSIIVAKGCLI